MFKKILLTAIIGLNSYSYAAEFKLGYIDVNKIFTTASPAIALQNSLKKTLASEEEQLKKMNENLLKEQEIVKNFEKKSIDQLKASDKTKLQKFQKDQLDFQQKYVVFQNKAHKLQDYASALLLNKANVILKNISEDGNYDLVVTSSQLVYAKPKYDLTDQVIEKLKAIDAKELVKQLDKASLETKNK